MSTMRGLIPSLGAGGSLIGAALCALAVLGGVLAFRGEVPGTAEADTGELKLPVGQVRAAAEPRPSRPAVTPPRPIATTRVAARARRVASPRIRVTTPRSDDAVPRMTTPAVPPRPQPATPPSEPRPAAPSTPRAVAPPTAPAPPAILPAGTVQRTVTQTRAAAQPVVEAAPAPVQAPVQQVADTVEQVAATVDGVTGALLP